MALHGLSGGRNEEQMSKYKWIGGNFGSFSNIYYKYLNGKTYWRGDKDIFNGKSYPDYFIGDKEGKPVGGTAFAVTCKAAWNDTESGDEQRKYGGPCQFRVTHPGRVCLKEITKLLRYVRGFSLKLNCSGCAIPSDSDLQMRRQCFDNSGKEFVKKAYMEGCESAELIEKDGYLIQKGGPAMTQDESCEHSIIAFVMPYELGFVLNYTMVNHYPRGCGPLDGDWRLTGMKPDCNSPYCKGHPKSNRLYIGSPGYDGSPPCGANTFKLEGEEESSSEIVAAFADSHDEWQKSFFSAWEKMQLNGYNKKDMIEGPENGNLLAQ